MYLSKTRAQTFGNLYGGGKDQADHLINSPGPLFEKHWAKVSIQSGLLVRGRLGIGILARNIAATQQHVSLLGLGLRVVPAYTKDVVRDEKGNCDYKQLADSNCIYVNKIMHEIDELTHIVSDVVSDPTLPRSEDHPCPKMDCMLRAGFQCDSFNTSMLATWSIISPSSRGRTTCNTIHYYIVRRFNRRNPDTPERFDPSGTVAVTFVGKELPSYVAMCFSRDGSGCGPQLFLQVALCNQGGQFVMNNFQFPNISIRPRNVTSYVVTLSGTPEQVVGDMDVDSSGSSIEGTLDDIIRLPSPVIICVEMNAHHVLWDSPYIDRCGIKIHETLVVESNTGKFTRLNRPPCPNTYPDVTFASPCFASYLTWDTIGDSMGSDHLPIILTIEAQVLYNYKTVPLDGSCNFKKANWELYSTKVELTVQNLVVDRDHLVQYDNFVNAL
uniref:Endonuclease/exonuclease/phosphatase domain-containing protein n=1 Tax=Timema poppense TaxID=170557 RepID=A0A7R9GRJ0_TIMPO|nr:unnamed protein product [Timema poppensis]